MELVVGRLRCVQAILGRAEEIIGILLVAGLAAVVNLQIFARYLFNAPFIWPEEIARLLLVWMTFLGAAALTRRGADIAVDTFVLLMPTRFRRFFLFARDLIMICLFGFVAFQGFELAKAVSGMPLIATGMPTAMLAWPLAICGVLTCFHCGLRVITLLFTDEEPPLEVQVHT
jgi:TRAP-type C4-dicarboxylate transport system permease small subunit